MQHHHVICFGELLLRFSSSAAEFLGKENGISIYPGGSEANVAAALGQSNIKVSYISALPENSLAESAKKALSDLGVDISRMVNHGSRIGSYYLLSANGLTNGEVVYDRKFSAFSSLQPGQLDYDTLLKDGTWLHWSALTPGLSLEMASLMLEVLKAAKVRGMKISVDLNYRSKLWDYGKTPLEVMPELLSYCDVIMGNIWAANKMIGTKVSDELNRETTPEVYFEHAIQSASEIFDRFEACQHVANTFRFMDHPKHNLFYGTYHNRRANAISNVFETQEVVDRIGSGDAFMAGLIYGLTHQTDPKEIIDTATKAGYNKLFVKGDFGQSIA